MANETLKGLGDIRLRLQGLPPRLVKNVLKAGLRQGANVVKDEAKSMVPKDSGAAAASIRVVARRGTPDRVVFNVVAGDLSGKQQSKFGQKSAFYVLFLEKGTVKMPPRPFMRPALEQKAQEAIDTVAQIIAQKLAGEVK